mmetsp:Transcript_31077/g.56531  ORF Transcript_31077/g.56531 Transcript_31077/m.56531 type:complete len:316 (-) Transcript_31077:265-1212(-)
MCRVRCHRFPRGCTQVQQLCQMPHSLQRHALKRALLCASCQSAQARCPGIQLSQGKGAMCTQLRGSVRHTFGSPGLDDVPLIHTSVQLSKGTPQLFRLLQIRDHAICGAKHLHAEGRILAVQGLKLCHKLPRWRCKSHVYTVNICQPCHVCCRAIQEGSWYASCCRLCRQGAWLCGLSAHQAAMCYGFAQPSANLLRWRELSLEANQRIGLCVQKSKCCLQHAFQSLETGKHGLCQKGAAVPLVIGLHHGHVDAEGMSQVDQALHRSVRLQHRSLHDVLRHSLLVAASARALLGQRRRRPRAKRRWTSGVVSLAA